MRGGACGLAGIAFDMDPARHHVFRNSDPGIAMHYDGCALVHPGTVISGVAFDLDRDRGIDPGGNGMRAFGIGNGPVGLIGIGRQRMQRRIKVALGHDGKVDSGHQWRSQT